MDVLLKAFSGSTTQNIEALKNYSQLSNAYSMLAKREHPVAP
jgi:hypothetical protein